MKERRGIDLCVNKRGVYFCRYFLGHLSDHVRTLEEASLEGEIRLSHHVGMLRQYYTYCLGFID